MGAEATDAETEEVVAVAPIAVEAGRMEDAGVDEREGRVLAEVVSESCGCASRREPSMDLEEDVDDDDTADPDASSAEAPDDVEEEVVVGTVVIGTVKVAVSLLTLLPASSVDVNDEVDDDVGEEDG